MTSNNLFLNKLKESTEIRLSLLFGLMFAMMITVSLISIGLSQDGFLSEKNSLLLSSALQCVFVFVLPAWATAKFSSPKPTDWLKLNAGFSIKNLIGVIIVYLVSLPFMNQIIAWNESMTFPEIFSGVENQLRAWENSGKATSQTLLSSEGIGSLIVGILTIGFLTGFSEEIFFRGALQRIMKRPLKVHGTIWFTAFVFSAFHFQFFGFVPRLLMGAFFGYLLYWTGSLWVPVFAHALNNSIVVVTAYIFGTESETLFIDSVGIAESGFPWMAAISGVLTLIFIYQFKDFFFKGRKQNIPAWQ